MSKNDDESEPQTRCPCPECGAVGKCYFGCRYRKNKNDNNQCHNCIHL